MKRPSNGISSALLCLALLAGCGGGQSSGPSPSSGEAASGGADPADGRSASGQEPSDPGASEATGSSAPARPTPELVRRLALEPDALEAAVEPARGAVFVRYTSDPTGEDPEADETGLIEMAERVCGSALQRRLDALRRDLALRIEQSAFDPLFSCERSRCTFPAEMEYDLSGELIFRSGPGGEPVLDAVVRIEGGTVTEAFRDAGEAFAREQLEALGGGRCPTAAEG